MLIELRNTIGGLKVLDPIVLSEGFEAFAILGDARTPLDYATLDEAMAAGWIVVMEVNEGGSVPELSVTNNGDTMVLIIAGEQLVGAKQNRVLNVTIMIPARTQMEVPVSCVERGRWGYNSRTFRSSGSSSHYLLRKMMSCQSSGSYRRTGKPSSDQGEVWREVDRKLGCVGSYSGSSALDQVYADYDRHLKGLLDRIRLPDDTCGVLFAIGGKIAGMDVFDKPETLRKLLPKLAKAYAIDALEATARAVDRVEDQTASFWSRLTQLLQREKPKPSGLDRGAVGRWLRSALRASFERFDSPGVGDDVRIESREVVGAGLVVMQCPVHLELFSR